MLMTRANKDTIVITIENLWDWMDLFDNGVKDEISLDLDSEILDVFFPDWDTYVDEEKPFDSLNLEDINAIKILHVVIATDVQEIEDLDGEGLYDVLSCDCILANAELEQVNEQPDFEDFLEYTGTMTFKISPYHPLP